MPARTRSTPHPGKQQNPRPPRSLAWITRIVARLGGWTGYYKPPGPKVIRRGWNRFAAMAEAEGCLRAKRFPSAQIVTDHVRIP